MDTPLAGLGVWITRPAHQAGAWADAVRAAGARVLVEPLLTIEPATRPRAAARALAAAETADIVIATSPNAVDHAWRSRPGFAPRGALYAVGAHTATALETMSRRPVARPAAGFTSEHLLALPALRAARRRRVALLSGEGGRGLIADTLARRGAEVDKIALYRRRPAAIERSRLAALLAEADAVVVTSGEALAHLIELSGAELARDLAAVRLVAPSERVVKKHAGPNWAQPPLLLPCMSTRALVAALAQL